IGMTHSSGPLAHRIQFTAVQRDIERIIIPERKIAQRVAELAEMITADHGVRGAGEITIIPILAGAMIFTADLIRHLPMRMEIGLLTVSSYPGRSIRSQGASILSEQIGDLRGRHVVLIDDIIDSGDLKSLLRPYGRLCPARRRIDLPAASSLPLVHPAYQPPLSCDCRFAHAALGYLRR